LNDPRARAYFLDADGKPWPVGHVLRNRAFAATLRKIAREGASAFYRGDLARDVVAAVGSNPSNPGDLTLGDLAEYRVKIREPVCGAYRRYRVCGMPPPSSGGITTLQILALLERYDLASLAPASFFAVHLMSEAGRLAYADRDVYIADPDFVAQRRGLLDRGYLAQRADRIRADASLGRASAGTPPEEDERAHRVADSEHAALEFPSTSHISIVDRDGNAVAMTTTIEDTFGSRLMTAGGFLLNNELTDFSFVPEVGGKPVANRIEPRKRPRSAMAPTIVYDASGRVTIVAGSAGGSAIINYVVKTLVGVIDWKLDPQATVALPNFGSRNGPTELESDTAVAALAPKLESIGHAVAIIDQTSGTQAIVRTNVGWVGGGGRRILQSAREEREALGTLGAPVRLRGLPRL
jgi:gamma-glutamyltranspeptidase/glutathione hydrolase